MSTNLYLSILKIAGEEVPLKSFSFSAPASALGVRVSAELADPSVEFSRGDSCDLILKHRGGADPRSRLIKAGKVASRGKNIAAIRRAGLSAPNDSLSLSATDRIADKWRLAPRIPVILFDPAIITLQEGETNTHINSESGGRIYAAWRALDDLDFTQIMKFAYVEGCGFSDVITNIPNYQIPRVDFPLNASYHNIAQSFYSFFRPVVYEDDNRLFIIDILGNIPEGILSGARNVNTNKFIFLNREQPETSIVNAVLLTHKYINPDAFDEILPVNVTQRTETENRDAGTPGDDGWQHMEETKTIIELHDDAENPDKITSEVVFRTETVTTGKDENGTTRILTRETQQDSYAHSWRLKLGYTKTLYSFSEDTTDGSTPRLRNMQTEVNKIAWVASQRHFGEYEKVWAQTQTEGLVIIEDDGETVTKTPLLEAARNHSVPKNDEPIRRQPITSVIEYWRYTGADQIEVHIQKIDHTTNRTEQTKTVSHVGTNAVRVRTGEAINTETVLLKDEASDTENGAREPLSFDAGFVPYMIAKELAFRELEIANSPLDRVRCQLATFDAGIRRGSIRKVHDREGNSAKVFVTGYDIQGSAGERGQINISQTIEGVVLSQA